MYGKKWLVVIVCPVFLQLLNIYKFHFRGLKYWHVSLFREIKTSKIKLLFFLQSHFFPWLYKNIFNVYILIASLVYAHPRTMCFLILPSYYSLWTKRGSTFPLRLNIFRLHVSHCLLKVCLKKRKKKKRNEYNTASPLKWNKTPLVKKCRGWFTSGQSS